jgi:hypothetical protein
VLKFNFQYLDNGLTKNEKYFLESKGKSYRKRDFINKAELKTRTEDRPNKNPSCFRLK